jgi:high affinity Mn2+ porin
VKRTWAMACLVLLAPSFALAENTPENQDGNAPPEEQWSVHAQATYISQQKPAFNALYTGPESLTPGRAHSYSFTSTLFLGSRLWSGAEGYANLEGVQGLPISNLTGLGGLTNGELQKTTGTSLKWYRARLFVRQVIGFGDASEAVEADKNQLGTTYDKRRLVITAGNLSIMDIFDDNRYAHDPRTDFMNWSLTTSGAYDFAADSRGYSWGAAVEWIDDGWAMRAGRFAQPKESNGLPLDFRLFEHYGDQVELERSVELGSREGKIRVLAFRNVAIMGRFRDAIEAARETGGVPSVAAVRKLTSKYGVALNVEQEVADNLGVFARVSWSNGQAETFAFAEIDRSLALGAVLEGKRWGRAADELGVAFVANGLSSAHRDYLAAGGVGFFVGDGRINYHEEQIDEAYYSIELRKNSTLTFDGQRIRNPAYNADRGPASFYAVRLHLEF